MTPNTQKLNDEQRTANIANEIINILREIHFGSVEIIIHENKVVQIERKEKLRFDNK
ncbi:MAG: YezD family protein [Methylococcaceae bacterium]|nr:YezD family protein [Methylococcaceae bacterium]